MPLLTGIMKIETSKIVNQFKNRQIRLWAGVKFSLRFMLLLGAKKTTPAYWGAVFGFF